MIKVLLTLCAVVFVSGTITDVSVFNPNKPYVYNGCTADIKCFVDQDTAKLITYKWRYDGRELADECTNTLKITANESMNDKYYQCIVTDSDGEKSEYIKLSVITNVNDYGITQV